MHALYSDRKQERRSVRNGRTVNRKLLSVSKDDGPCETYGPSTANNCPYQCGSIGHECFIVHAASNSMQEKWKARYSHNFRQN